MVQVARNVTMEAWGFLAPGQYLIHDRGTGRVEANVARVRAFLSPPGSQVLLIDAPAAEQFDRF